MKSYLEVIRGYLGVVGLLVADEGHKVRSLEIAGAALEVVGPATFRRHHLLGELKLIDFQLFPRAQKNVSFATRLQISIKHARKEGRGRGRDPS